jgi:hypothetical protein
MGGRLKGITVAARICCPAPNTLPISACAEFAAPARSANGFRVGTTNPVLGSITPTTIEKPTIANMFWTYGIERQDADTGRQDAQAAAAPARSVPTGFLFRGIHRHFRNEAMPVRHFDLR